MRGWADRVRRTVLTGSAFLLFFSCGVALSYVVLPLARLGERDARARARRCRRIVRRTWIFFHDYMRVTGLPGYDPRKIRLELPPAPYVLVANHPTLVDVTAIGATVPDATIIAKSSMFRNPFVGPVLRYCDHIAVGHDGPFSGAAVVDDAVARLEAGIPVLIFPEGTRSPEHGLGRFQAGAFVIAARAQVPVIPLLVRCEPPTLMRGRPWYDIPDRPPVMTIRQLPTVEVRGRRPVLLARELEDSYRRLVVPPSENPPLRSIASTARTVHRHG
ncbi:MAG: 1-acyl-sn-glycerol-3-phosphate acyltransferase [Anaeromyxobacteraceae bacterium]|nr:1-acyl-sn-glycerol-3-phosphate acyltransferase [Anaeromyxobacteraceae bacterium]